MSRTCQLSVVRCPLSAALPATRRMPRTDHNGPRTTDHGLRRAFTLIEMLVVIGVIMLIILLAVPAFNILNGSRSQEAAQNQLSALLGRARMEAMGLQEYRGVFFYIDPATDRVHAALVAGVTPQGTTTADPGGVHYLDLLPDRDYLAMPPGIGVQTIDDAALNGTSRQDDGYIGYNRLAGGSPGKPPKLQYGGVILFDGNGRLANDPYGFVLYHDPD